MSVAPSADWERPMQGRKILLYFAWSRAGEIAAPLTIIDDRFPAVFELRRLFYPNYEHLADSATVNQGAAGFLDHIQKPNFLAFAEQTQTGRSVIQVERGADDGAITRLDDALIADADTIVVISFDSLKTGQVADETEVQAVQRFLSHPDHLIFVCPHHDIGEASEVSADERQERQIAEHLHHGDRGSPPRQGFGGFARTLLAGLGVPVENRFGLRPAANTDGSPQPIEAERSLDDLGLLRGVETFNLHPHLPQLERLGESLSRLEVLARQDIDLSAPPHPFVQGGRTRFDALLQSRPETFAGRLLVCDTTIFSATAGGVESLQRFWANIAGRPRRV
jgi:hypothetical protein